MTLSIDMLEIENKEIVDLIVVKSMKLMGHHPFSKNDFQRATDTILIDELGIDYMIEPILSDDTDIYQIVCEVVNYLADYINEY